jgi:D-aminoacyl-tRNA deacylase
MERLIYQLLTAFARLYSSNSPTLRGKNMIAVIQRVKSAHVEVEGVSVGAIGAGALILLCIEKGDSEETAVYWAKRIPELRFFSDSDGKMNLSLTDLAQTSAKEPPIEPVGALVVSQFTLAADLKEKGRRPSFSNAEAPERAKALVEVFVKEMKACGVHVEQGRFGALMQVSLINDGPVTFTVDTP